MQSQSTLLQLTNPNLVRRQEQTPGAAAIEAVDRFVDDGRAAVPVVVVGEVARPVVAGSLDVELPLSSADEVTIAGQDVEVGLSLPGKAVDADIAATGDMTYADVTESTSMTVRALDDGAVQILATMHDRAASAEQVYDVDLPDGAVLEARQDGSVAVMDGNTELGWFDAPWAYDASGRELVSRYELRSGSLVQHTEIDSRAEFPIVADPRYNGYYADCGITTCTRWVDVSITKYIHDNRFNSTIAYWSLAMGVNCAPVAIFTGPGGVVCALLGLALIADFTNNLEQAALRGNCLKVKYSRPGGYATPLDYDDTSPTSSKCYP